MKTIIAALLFSASALALAHNCPNEMKAIDAKLETSSGLSDAKLAEVRALRAEGEKLHKEGKHTESMKALQEAKTILGITG